MSAKKSHPKPKAKPAPKKVDRKPVSKTPAVKKKSAPVTKTTKTTVKKTAAKTAKKPPVAPTPTAPKKIPAETSFKIEKPVNPAPIPAKEHRKAAAKPNHTLTEDLPLDMEEKEALVEEEKKDLAEALEPEEDGSWEAAFVPTDTSERYILIVDEEGQRRNETTTIISQILPNAIVEVADDPDEALEMMQDCEFDTFVVNFLMPGYSASPFVKAVANHPEHPLLIGFAADKISDAVDPKKGLKIIPLKRLFDLDASAALEGENPGEAEK